MEHLFLAISCFGVSLMFAGMGLSLRAIEKKYRSEEFDSDKYYYSKDELWEQPSYWKFDKNESNK